MFGSKLSRIALQLIDKSNNMVVVLKKKNSPRLHMVPTLAVPNPITPQWWSISPMFSFMPVISWVLSKRNISKLGFVIATWKSSPRSGHLPFLSNLSSAPAWLPWDEMQSMLLTLPLLKQVGQKMGRKDTREWTRRLYGYTLTICTYIYIYIFIANNVYTYQLVR